MSERKETAFENTIQRPTTLVPPLKKHVLQSTNSQYGSESPDNLGIIIPR